MTGAATVHHPRYLQELPMRKRSITGLLLLLPVGWAVAATPLPTVEIRLQDSSVDPAIAHMRIVATPQTIKPGRVTFHAVNESKNQVHEVIVTRNDGTKPLPMDAKQDRVIEKRVHPLGEISDLAPGKSGSLTVTLKAGTYVLFCNEPGHYHDGMATTLTVAP
jgi:uncharacterized cupredoxin-like copper-binding protein